MLTSRVSIGSEDISWGSRKNPFIEIPFPDDWHWIFLPSCSVSVKAVYSSFAIWNRAHGHLLISLHPTCFCVQPRLNAERSQYKWRFQSIYLSVQPRLNARDRCKSDFILSVDIFREARRGLSDKYLLRSQRVSPIIYWAKIIQYNPHSISTKPFLSPLIFYWATKHSKIIVFPLGFCEAFSLQPSCLCAFIWSNTVELGGFRKEVCFSDESQYPYEDSCKSLIHSWQGNGELSDILQLPQCMDRVIQDNPHWFSTEPKVVLNL